MTASTTSNMTLRSEGKATLTMVENGETRSEEIRISFARFGSHMWNELIAVPSIAKRLHTIDLQSPDIIDDNGQPYQLKESDFNRFDVLHLSQLWDGVVNVFWKG